MKKYILIISIFFLNLTNIVFAEKSNEIIELENKINNLEYKLDIIKKSNYDYLEMVKWVIGLIGALFGGIIFLSWFQNFKLGKKEIENIKEDIKNYNEIIFSEIKNENEKQLDKKINFKINNLKKDIYELEHDLFVNKDIEFAYLFNEKLEKDINNNIYNIDDTINKLEKFIKDKNLRIDEKIEIKGFLEKFIKKMESNNDSFLDSSIIDCKTIIKKYLGDLD